MFTKADYKGCCVMLKEKFFAGLIDDESILILSPNGKEYCASVFNKDDEKSDGELYLYRLLTREEHDEIKSLQLPENWLVQANEKQTEFALIYEKYYRVLPTIDEITMDILNAINYVVKEVET